MKRIFATIILVLAFLPFRAYAAPKEMVVFEATIVRLDSWGLVKFSCGVAINYRLAEYKVYVVHSGHLVPGAKVVVRHLACNWNELNDLKVGDQVIVVAEMLHHPEKRFWTSKPNGASTLAPADDTDRVDVLLKQEPVLVRYNSTRVAKLIYPTSP